MADGAVSYFPGGYIAAGRRLGLTDADVRTTLWLVDHDPDCRHSARDPRLLALRKHAAIERGSYVAVPVLDAIDDPAARELLDDAIAYSPRRRKGTRPRWERCAEEDRRKARETHQLWFCGLTWRTDAANDDADDDDDDDDGEAE